LGEQEKEYYTERNIGLTITVKHTQTEMNGKLTMHASSSE
jgi:hypothetical protein